MFWILAIVQGPVFFAMSLSFVCLLAFNRTPAIVENDRHVIVDEKAEKIYHRVFCGTISLLLLWVTCVWALAYNTPLM